MALLLVAQQILVLAAAPISTAVVWQGTMSYPCTSSCAGGKWLVHEGPITITIDTAIASTDWVWTVLPVPGHATEHCVPKHEAGLKVESPAAGTAGRWYARGSGGDSSFYSLEATLDAGTNTSTLTDGVIYFGQNQSAGTFEAARGGFPPANSTCVPPPPPPRGIALWPLPGNVTTAIKRYR